MGRSTFRTNPISRKYTTSSVIIQRGVGRDSPERSDGNESGSDDPGQTFVNPAYNSEYYLQYVVKMSIV